MFRALPWSRKQFSLNPIVANGAILFHMEIHAMFRFIRSSLILALTESAPFQRMRSPQL